MKPKKAAPGSNPKPERNQLITRPAADNRQANRDDQIEKNLAKRGGPLLDPAPENVTRNRERVTQLRVSLLRGVNDVERFLVTGERLLIELQTMQGGVDAAKLEGLDLEATAKALHDLRATMDKHFPASA